MFEDLKEKVKKQEEKKVIQKALSTSNKFSKQRSHQFTTADEVIDYIRFKYPLTCFVQIINLDKTDAEGYPETNTKKIKEVNVTYKSTNTFGYRGKLTGAKVNYVFFQYDIVLAFVHNGEYKVIRQKINAESERDY